MDTPSPELLAQWFAGVPPTPFPTADGLINQTWRLEASGETVGYLQRLNTNIFSPRVHEDIAAVTSALAEAGLTTPRLIPTRSGALWAEHEGTWRLLTPVGSRTFHRVEDPSQARTAGRLVGRFHAAVADLDWEFVSVRPGAHDTPAHMAALERALDEHPRHRLRDAVAPVAEALLTAWASWEGPTDLPSRVIHGDLKLSNLRFDDAGEAVALVDLDTLQRGTLDAELGDALRSWCNPASEDAPRARFDLHVFSAAVEGYASASTAGRPTDAEWASLVPGVERIALELAARFARDALEESYFGWSAAYGTRGDHNLLRARGQLSLAQTVRAAQPHAARAVDRARRATSR